MFSVPRVRLLKRNPCLGEINLFPSASRQSGSRGAQGATLTRSYYTGELRWLTTSYRASAPFIFCDRRVSDATFRAVLKRLRPQGLTELTVTMGCYAMLEFALNAFDVQPEQPLLPV